MNYSILIDRVFTLLGEDKYLPQMWTRDQIGRYVNDAYVDIVRDSGAVECRRGLSSVAGQGGYVAPDDIGVLLRVAYDDYELKADTARRMDRNDPGWQSEIGTPERWIKSRKSPGVFTIYKAPMTTGSGSNGANSEYGKIVQITGSGITVQANGEYGRLGLMLSGDVAFTATYSTPNEYGRVCRLSVSQSNIELWGKKNPYAMTLKYRRRRGYEGDGTDPELPAYAHMGIAFRAAEYALRDEKEGRNEELAAVYGAIADEYEGFLRDMAALRMPERDSSPSTGFYDPRTYRLYRETEIPATGLPGVT